MSQGPRPTGDEISTRISLGSIRHALYSHLLEQAIPALHRWGHTQLLWQGQQEAWPPPLVQPLTDLLVAFVSFKLSGTVPFALCRSGGVPDPDPMEVAPGAEAQEEMLKEDSLFLSFLSSSRPPSLHPFLFFLASCGTSLTRYGTGASCSGSLNHGTVGGAPVLQDF